MAQFDSIHQNGQTSRTVEQLLRSWKIPLTFAKVHDPEEDHFHQGNKSYVISKVMDKAKKLRESLVRKRDIDDVNKTPSWGVSLEDYEEEDIEHLGASMNRSEKASENCDNIVVKQARVDQMISENIVFDDHQREEAPTTNETAFTKEKEEDETTTQNMTYEKEEEKPCISQKMTETKNTEEEEEEQEKKPPRKTIKEAILEKLTPAYATVYEATHKFTSKIQDASFTEYIKSKLEPGENERALSQIISELIHPKGTPSEKSILKTIREALTLLLHTEEPSPPSSTKNVDPSYQVPVSTNAYEAEEEHQGRIPQAN